jgi:hypothetical protein
MSDKESHRLEDSRVCGAITNNPNQGTVYSGNKLWAVVGATNSHGGGQLKKEGDSAPGTVLIENKPVIVGITPAQIDGQGHVEQVSASSSWGGKVYCYN